jgi:hypothetical protein
MMPTNPVNNSPCVIGHPLPDNPKEFNFDNESEALFKQYLARQSKPRTEPPEPVQVSPE